VVRTVLVVIHASAGVGGLLTGLAALSPPSHLDNRGWVRRLYQLCIAILLVSMVVLVAIDWNGLDVGGRVAFSGLTALGAVMAYRIARASREAARQEPRWQDRYIRHVYFTYISLWEGFVILPALNLPLPQLSVPLVAIAVLLIGHVLIARYRSRILAA
jgi:NhaP-type Na+/H+ or K+/H+ antiporter